MYTIINLIQHSIIPLHTQYNYIYTWRIPACFSHPLLFPLHPFVFLLCPLLLTWHPPDVIGIVHLPVRLLVNWPCLPHPSPNWPTLPKFPEPHLPAPNNDDLRNIPTLANRNTNLFSQEPFIDGKDWNICLVRFVCLLQCKLNNFQWSRIPKIRSKKYTELSKTPSKIK